MGQAPGLPQRRKKERTERVFRSATLSRTVSGSEPNGFLQVVPGAQQLDVLCQERGAPLQEREDVVEVQIVGLPAQDAACPITRVDLRFHRGGNHTVEQTPP